MPRLKVMKFEMESPYKFTLYLWNKADKINLGWECYWPPYQPDGRVANAWNFDLDDVRIHSRFEEKRHVILQTWPPDTPVNQSINQSSINLLQPN
jgi:hypothetical protein